MPLLHPIAMLSRVEEGLDLRLGMYYAHIYTHSHAHTHTHTHTHAHTHSYLRCRCTELAWLRGCTLIHSSTRMLRSGRNSVSFPVSYICCVVCCRQQETSLIISQSLMLHGLTHVAGGQSHSQSVCCMI